MTESYDVPNNQTDRVAELEKKLAMLTRDVEDTNEVLTKVIHELAVLKTYFDSTRISKHLDSYNSSTP